MSTSASRPAHTPRQLLTAARVKALLTLEDPGYGKEFAPEEWERIAERLSALTRLLYRMRTRQLAQPKAEARSGSSRKENGVDPPALPVASTQSQ
ncbi:MAG: hypothetical protein ACK47B_12460 [Armatimonadota bacterium]